jgi:hypothetical protein
MRNYVKVQYRSGAIEFRFFDDENDAQMREAHRYATSAIVGGQHVSVFRRPRLEAWLHILEVGDFPPMPAAVPAFA